MPSLSDGKDYIVRWVKDHFPSGATCLDVGACDGKWFSLLGDYLDMYAVEIFRPYVEKHELESKYVNVFVGDIDDYKYGYYDLIIFGDVIEHMDVPKAQRVLAYARQRCENMIIAVPFMYKQDMVRGNKWERHIQDELTPELFDELYPGYELLFKPVSNYAYYIKRKDG